MVLEDSGQPVGDIGSRRTTHAPIGHGRLSTLLASVEVPTTRCVRSYADVRFGGDFDPFTASTLKQPEVLLERVKAQMRD